MQVGCTSLHASTIEVDKAVQKCLKQRILLRRERQKSGAIYGFLVYEIYEGRLVSRISQLAESQLPKQNHIVYRDKDAA